jgi:hypothetical protein
VKGRFVVHHLILSSGVALVLAVATDAGAATPSECAQQFASALDQCHLQFPDPETQGDLRIDCLLQASEILRDCLSAAEAESLSADEVFASMLFVFISMNNFTAEEILSAFIARGDPGRSALTGSVADLLQRLLDSFNPADVMTPTQCAAQFVNHLKFCRAANLSDFLRKQCHQLALALAKKCRGK